jgi:hypothetical protein
MKTVAPVWPAILILVAAILMGVASLAGGSDFEIDEKWVAGIALMLFVPRWIYILHIGRKPNPTADVARMRQNIHRGLRDKN